MASSVPTVVLSPVSASASPHRCLESMLPSAFFVYFQYECRARTRFQSALAHDRQVLDSIPRCSHLMQSVHPRLEPFNLETTTMVLHEILENPRVGCSVHGSHPAEVLRPARNRIWKVIDSRQSFFVARAVDVEMKKRARLPRSNIEKPEAVRQVPRALLHRIR